MNYYFKAERYMESLLNLSIVKKVPSYKIKDDSHYEYFKKEGVSREDVEEGMGLKRMKRLMEKLGNPQEGLKILHIAGTSGKGSVSTIAHEILRRTSLKTGLYTSPHLTLVMERIKLGDKFISPEDFVKYLNMVKSATDDMYENEHFGPPSYHETIFSTALLYLQQEKPDISVIETGLGWRNDYTKVIPSSLVSVITNISYDHTDYLGNTLESIASNKADIIAENSICITGCTDDKILSVIKDKADKKKSSILVMGRDFGVIPAEVSRDCSSFTYKSRNNYFKDLMINLPGKHQMLNAGIAIASVEEIFKKFNVPLEEDIVREALGIVKIPGRMEVISESPKIILDGAHNPAKIGVLCDYLKEISSHRKLIFIVGVIEGKDIKVMLEKIVPLADLVIATLPRVAGRVSVSPKQVLNAVNELGGKGIIKLDPFDAVRYASSIVDENDLLCITGSLYLVGELRTLWVTKEDIVEKRDNYTA